jgi:hypothetical protein
MSETVSGSPDSGEILVRDPSGRSWLSVNDLKGETQRSKTERGPKRAGQARVDVSPALLSRQRVWRLGVVQLIVSVREAAQPCSGRRSGR